MWPQICLHTVLLCTHCVIILVNPLNAELNSICYLLALLGAHHFLHVSKIRVKSLTLRLLMSYIYIYIYDISRLRFKSLLKRVVKINKVIMRL